MGEGPFISQKRQILMSIKVILFIILSFFVSSYPKCELEPFKILTINLLYTETQDRIDRYQKIADYIIENEINIILLQECVSDLPYNQNSANYLQELLNEYHNYFLFYDIEDEPFGNAILSAYPIIHTSSYELQTSILEKSLSWKRRVLLAQLQLTDNKLNVYSTHLCAGCNIVERQNQTRQLLNFIKMNNRKYCASASILGGDFNINIDIEPTSYRLITRYFYDTFLKANNLEFDSWCNENSDIGCTYGIKNNPYAYGPKRIDYIFSSKNLNPTNSEVIFNFDKQWVSDHCGLLTEF